MTRTSALKTVHVLSEDLQFVKESVYDKCGLDLVNFSRNPEGADYDACCFMLDGKSVQYRASRITPTKSGQFVAIWKRNKEGITEPFNVIDGIDFIIITSKKSVNFGQFIFPKTVLAERGVMTLSGKEGKRGIRVYPPWDKPENKQAGQTQLWQKEFFVSMKGDKPADLNLLKRLLEW